MVWYSYHFASMVLISKCITHLLNPRIQSTSDQYGPSWSWVHEAQVTSGPRAKSDPSPVIVGPGGNTPFWYDVYIQQRMKVKTLLSFVVSFIYGVACSTTLHTFCTVEYESHLISTGPSWSWDHEWRVTPGPRTRSGPSPVILGQHGQSPFCHGAYI